MSLSLSGAFAIGNVIAYATTGKTLRLWQDKGYYPSQWGHTGGSLASMVMEKVNIGGFFVDAVFHGSAEHTLTITQHPVQTGANLADHAFINPVRLSMDIGISDVMAYRSPGCYDVPGETKSVSAYRSLCKLQRERKPLRVLTRLDTYENMLIESIITNDDVSTQNALKASIELVQVPVAEVTEEKVSSRQWTSAQEGKSQEVQPQPEQESTIATIRGDSGYYNPDAGGVAP